MDPYVSFLMYNSIAGSASNGGGSVASLLLGVALGLGFWRYSRVKQARERAARMERPSEFNPVYEAVLWKQGKPSITLDGVIHNYKDARAAADKAGFSDIRVTLNKLNG